MNKWTELSIDYANQRSYLDDLFRVYPTIPEGIRDINKESWSKIEQAFCDRDNYTLVHELLKLDLFPIKDSYIAYLRRDVSALDRNPKTINRICGRLYEMGIDKIFERCTEPKETNRQIGPMFRAWLKRGSLGVVPVDLETFLSGTQDAVLDGSDEENMIFARKHLGYNHDKGFNNKYVIGEAKFLTDFGGHQNSQFNDAINTVKTKGVNAVKVAVLDGVLYIKSKSKMHKKLKEYEKYNIMSSLVLLEFLYQI